MAFFADVFTVVLVVPYKQRERERVPRNAASGRDVTVYSVRAMRD
jgi:hypothetical protein